MPLKETNHPAFLKWTGNVNLNVVTGNSGEIFQWLTLKSNLIMSTFPPKSTTLTKLYYFTIKYPKQFILTRYKNKSEGVNSIKNKCCITEMACNYG